MEMEEGGDLVDLIHRKGRIAEDLVRTLLRGLFHIKECTRSKGRTEGAKRGEGDEGPQREAEYSGIL